MHLPHHRRHRPAAETEPTPPPSPTRKNGNLDRDRGGTRTSDSHRHGLRSQPAVETSVNAGVYNGRSDSPVISISPPESPEASPANSIAASDTESPSRQSTSPLPSLAVRRRAPHLRLQRTPSEIQHDNYLAKLEVPSLAQISSIAQIQEEREHEIEAKYRHDPRSPSHPHNHGSADGPREYTRAEREAAAGKIQRTYRGHRARRELAGLSLDPTTRWVEALRDAHYRSITNPKRRRASSVSRGSRPGSSDAELGPKAASGDQTPSSPALLSPQWHPHSAEARRVGTAGNAVGSEGVYEETEEEAKRRKSMDARNNWHHVTEITSHAMGELPKYHGDDNEKRRPRSQEKSSSSHRLSSITESSSDGSEDGEETAPHRQGWGKKKKKKPWAGKMMDLPYFLEMVDVKHRYGSNLRRYHSLWMGEDTTENFFFWLDYGEGKDVEVEGVSRIRLEKEQVRYLSREERMDYLVNVDSEGRLVWAKNGQRITTSTEYRDSVDGIVPQSSPVKAWREDENKALDEQADQNDKGGPSSAADGGSSGWSASTLSSPTASPLSSPEPDEAERRYPDPPGMKQSKGPKKVKHVTPQAILDRLLRMTVSANTWIFAADTSMNLYVGIKQSGAFQHSSFMHGSRLSAAGTIKIKDGQLRALNPLSGHYRPPAKAFRHFEKHLRDEAGVDVSRVSISKSYAVLIGLEAYLNSKKKAKKAERKVKHGAERVLHPARARERRERDKDHSESAELERTRLREEQGSGLRSALRDAKEKVEERLATLDARRLESGNEGREGEEGEPERKDEKGKGETPESHEEGQKADEDPKPKIDESLPTADVPHQHGFDKAYKQG